LPAKLQGRVPETLDDGFGALLHFVGNYTTREEFRQTFVPKCPP
jgi:hypothetical protein